MSIKLTDLLEEIVSKISSRMHEEETPLPEKRKRGRPSKADVAARLAAAQQAQSQKAMAGMSSGLKADIQAAKERRAKRDAESMAAARAELDAAMKNKDVNVHAKGKETGVALPPEDIQLPSFRGSSKSRTPDDEGDELDYDIDRARKSGLVESDESDAEEAKKMSQDLEDYAAGNTRAHKKAMKMARKIEKKGKK